MSQKPIVKIAHRGYSDLYGDNNMISFQKAYEAGFDVIELDIQLNADQELVVHHNLHKDGIFISQMSHSQIRDNQIVFLKDVLEEFRYTNIILYLDLKGSVCVAECLVLYLETNPYPLERMWIASFNQHHLHVLQNSSLIVKLGFITANTFENELYETLLQNIDFFVCDMNILSYSLIQHVKHQMKKEIYVYTGSNKHDIDLCLTYEIDGIVSNILF